MRPPSYRLLDLKTGGQTSRKIYRRSTEPELRLRQRRVETSDEKKLGSRRILRIGIRKKFEVRPRKGEMRGARVDRSGTGGTSPENLNIVSGEERGVET